MVGDLAVTDAIMERTFFVGVYPGIDEPRMDYMIDVFRRFMDGERATAAGEARRPPRTAAEGARMAVVRKIACTVEDMADRGERVYTIVLRPPGGHRGSSPGSSSIWPSMPISPAGSGRSPGCSRSSARLGIATGSAITYAVKGAFTARMEARARRRVGRYGSSCPSGSSLSTGRETQCCSRAVPA